jgi:hypothetical protein
VARLKESAKDIRPRPADEQGRERERQRIKEDAEHANYCRWGEEFGCFPLFRIDEDGEVFCAHDESPVTDPRQILSEGFYWQEVEWGGSGLLHDEEGEAFRTLEGELAVSRDFADLRHLIGPGRGTSYEPL